MATIFPTTPIGVLPPEVLRAFQFFKKLPDEFTIWHHLAPWDREAPDFLLLNRQYQAALVKVSRAQPAEAPPAAQMLLLNTNRPSTGENEARVLECFLEHVADLDIPGVVLFPNIPQTRLIESQSPAARHTWLGKEALNPANWIDHWQPVFKSSPLDPAQAERLRAHFTPEAVVPSSLTVRLADPRRLEAGLTDYLLDFDQETALKAELNLPADRQALPRDFRLSVVNGVAGSGKTLILLYRLRLLHGLFPNQRFLVLTHNRPLIRDLRARFEQLTGALPRRIAWYTFNGWCRARWPDHPAWAKPLALSTRQHLVEEICRTCLSGAAITPGMLRSEIDWIKDQVNLNEEAYLSADRRGRGFRLSPEQRARLWVACQAYQQILQARGVLDWSDVPRRINDFIQQGMIHPPVYDVVLVDEAQFFAPLWFEILRHVVRPRSGHLFIAADPTQGFLGRGASWKSLGLDVRGRSHQLRRSYRTTQEILDFASLFYRQRIPQDDVEEEILVPDLLNMPSGVVPQLVPLRASQEEITRIANEIQQMAGRGFPLSQILVLHSAWDGAQSLRRAIQQRLGLQAAADPKDRPPGDYVRVTTLNAGTGLESPVVFLVGLNRLFEEEQSLRLSDTEREQVVRENTRKVYMAATRAGQRLVLTYVGELPEVLQGILR
ncbi:MAG: DEAD/DEAH box helicase [Anaerolineales bacterium]|nr:DEAD/DEAH box helicase [Anaerolineales bacterium]